MKNILTIGMVLLAGIMSITSCKKDVHALNTDVAAVSSLTLPANNASLVLQPSSGSGVVFQWAASSTKDLVLYEVAFDKADGNFSKPLYKVLADGSGVSNKATITQKTLNTIASMAGIASSSTGSLKWTVITSLAANSATSSAANTIQITRPAGFAVLPNALYLTGTATETGADLSKALSMKKVSDGVFELYTSLQAGTYNFAETATGTPTTYSIQNGTTVQAGGSTTVTGSKAVYRISVDLTTASAKLTQIVEVGYWSAPLGKIEFTLPYIGGSQWQADNTTVVVPQESYGLDSRYKYRFTVADATGTQSYEWYGSKNSDNPDPNSTTDPSYWNMVSVNNSQFDFCFKLIPAADNKSCKINVNYSPSIANYNNTITIK